jgi:predicted TIM-barrel fold metal-dependent hydrolase
MITGFNPTDMYAVDHIRRVLQIFPGVFSGIGEFSIHKEFVSSKVAGDVASLTDPAVDRILDFAGEVGLVVILHNDINTPFAKENAEPAYLEQMLALLRRHRKTTIIWAHTGLGRVVAPVKHHAAVLERILSDPDLQHVFFDISWDQTARYILANPVSEDISADLINRYPDRFLFGTDALAPSTREQYLKLYVTYEPLWNRLTPEAIQKVKRENYERLFDVARMRVRAWENANVRSATATSVTP